MGGNTKYCKECGIEKPQTQFSTNKIICKVCDWFKYTKPNLIEGWSLYEYKTVIGYIFYNKVVYINEITQLIDKSLDDIIIFFRNYNFGSKKIVVKVSCDQCGVEVQKPIGVYINRKNHYCSQKCKNEWQINNLVGDKNPKYNSIDVSCEICGVNIKRSKHRIKANKHHFCSSKCRKYHFNNIYSQSDEFKDIMRAHAINLLTTGVFTHTNTEPQARVNQILNDLNLKYENEYNCQHYSIDNCIKINDKILFIEVMGGFWHADHRLYKTINYDLQKTNIKIDKSKHNYIKKYFNVEILYLWELDILDNPNLCKELIYNYVNNKGLLSNYHSFNYLLNNKRLELNTTIISPYMKYDIEKLKNITDLSIKEKKDVYTKYICENCGKECSQYTHEFQKHINHFCGHNCRATWQSKNKNNKIKVQCNYCKQVYAISPSVYNKNKTKTFYCSKGCISNFYNSFKISTQCKYCSNPLTLSPNRKNESNNYFCNSDCAVKYRNKIKL